MSECTCVLCGGCMGSGRIEVATDGYPEWELETCPECDGSGVADGICNWCQDEEDREWRDEQWEGA